MGHGRLQMLGAYKSSSSRPSDEAVHFGNRADVAERTAPSARKYRRAGASDPGMPWFLGGFKRVMVRYGQRHRRCPI
jgi:hypothetical protein